MTSNINTNGINTSYPTPGVNNSTQGFRDNFNGIVNNLNTAASEITDLQNKVIVKSALNNVPLNNDMANTTISNCVTRSFRASMYDLGSSLSGNVTIDVSKGDVQYGVVTGNATLVFGSWMPTGTRGEVQLKLQFDTNSFDYGNTVITLPNTTLNGSTGNITAGFKDTVNSLEKVVQVQTSSTNVNNFLRIPTGTREMNFAVYSDDCGSTLDARSIATTLSINRIEVGFPFVTANSVTGQPGDVKGDMLTDGTNFYVCTNTYPTNAALIQYSDTYANLVSANAIINTGYFAKETDTGHFKLGDGNTHYTALTYYRIWKGITLENLT